MVFLPNPCMCLPSMENNMSNLEALLKAYTEMTALWAKASIGQDKQRVWKSCQFLEKCIAKVLANSDR
jgi:hypothetical protein